MYVVAVCVCVFILVREERYVQRTDNKWVVMLMIPIFKCMPILIFIIFQSFPFQKYPFQDYMYMNGIVYHAHALVQHLVFKYTLSTCPAHRRHELTCQLLMQQDHMGLVSSN